MSGRAISLILVFTRPAGVQESPFYAMKIFRRGAAAAINMKPRDRSYYTRANSRTVSSASKHASFRGEKALRESFRGNICWCKNKKDFLPVRLESTRLFHGGVIDSPKDSASAPRQSNNADSKTSLVYSIPITLVNDDPAAKTFVVARAGTGATIMRKRRSASY